MRLLPYSPKSKGEEIASKQRQINEITKEISKLKQSLQGYNQRRIALENEWNASIIAFIKENEPSTTSNLAEANTPNIIYELRRRGFKGIVQNDEIGESYDIDKHDWKQGTKMNSIIRHSEYKRAMERLYSDQR